jgi:hypothetical protein
MTHDTCEDRHLRLVTRMADALGADLETECFSGRLDPAVLDAMVVRCKGCTDPAGCERILGAPGTKLAHPPAQCRNADRLMDLAR